MIEIENAAFRYADGEGGALRGVSLRIPKGQCVLLCGASGCGKTTLLRLINGLIPHYYEGELSGSVTVNGLKAAQAELYEISRCAGSVFQNPRSQFFCVDTYGEVAFGCENMGLPVAEVEARVAHTAAQLRVEALLGRNIFELSGGEKQKIACASVSAMGPEIVVLDEPTSNLDADAIEALKQTVQLWKAQGKTVVIAEHRLYWLQELCDRAVFMEQGAVRMDLPMAAFGALPAQKRAELGLRPLFLRELPEVDRAPLSSETLQLDNFRYTYKNSRIEALAIDRLVLPRGGVIAVIGHNGAGKSTLSNGLCGLLPKCKAVCTVGGEKRGRRQMLKKSYLVMQDVNHQLFCDSVEDEVQLGMREENAADVERVLRALDLLPFRQRHPMSLSGGQKQRVAIACAILAEKDLMIFDEPTSGLDFCHMQATAALLATLRGQKTVLVVTHDPELILRCCDYVLHLENGRAAQAYPLDAAGCRAVKQFFIK